MASREYPLTMPDELYDELEKEAHIQGVSVLEFVRISIKLGLLVSKLERDPNSSFKIHQGNSVREVAFNQTDSK